MCVLDVFFYISNHAHSFYQTEQTSLMNRNHRINFDRSKLYAIVNKKYHALICISHKFHMVLYLKSYFIYSVHEYVTEDKHLSKNKIYFPVCVKCVTDILNNWE